MKKHLPSLTILTSAITSVILIGCGGSGSGGSSHTSSAISKSSPVVSSSSTSSIATANAAPVFTSGESISVDEGSKTPTGYIAIATDSDNDVLTYSLSGGADKASFAIDSKTGAVSFVAAPDFEQPVDANHDNISAT